MLTDHFPLGVPAKNEIEYRHYCWNSRERTMFAGASSSEFNRRGDQRFHFNMFSASAAAFATGVFGYLS